MLNNRDYQMIEDDIESIILDWPSTVEIWKLLPDEQQPGWDPIMHEVVGMPEYDKRTNITIMRRDIPLDGLETNVGGKKYNGESIISISSKINIDKDCLLILDSDYNHLWEIKSIQPRMGENIIRIFRLVGD